MATAEAPDKAPAPTGTPSALAPPTLDAPEVTDVAAALLRPAEVEDVAMEEPAASAAAEPAEASGPTVAVPPAAPAAPAAPVAPAIVPGPSAGLKLLADSATMQGRRPKQEDRHVKIPDLTKAAKAFKMPIDHLEQPCAFFAVYDGHQGTLCSEFLAKNFHVKLLKKLSVDPVTSKWDERRICGVLREICEELDTEFLAKFRTAPDGSTLVATLISGARVFTAWVGDSRAMLCRRSSQGGILTVPLTEDHRPAVQSEADRVIKAGGNIVDFGGGIWRVAHEGYEEKVRELRRAQAQGLGTIGKEPVALAVSRAMGDRDFKAVTGKALLIATPDVRCVRMDKSVKFLALMCDGIPDVMRNEDAIDQLVIRRDPNPETDIRAGCGALVQEAYKRGSEDNLTVIVIRFEWEGDVDVAAAKRSAGVSNGSSGESAVAASKRRRLEMAAAVKAQKIAAFERETAGQAEEPLIELVAPEVKAPDEHAKLTAAMIAKPGARLEVSKPKSEVLAPEIVKSEAKSQIASEAKPEAKPHAKPELKSEAESEVMPKAEKKADAVPPGKVETDPDPPPKPAASLGTFL